MITAENPVRALEPLRGEYFRLEIPAPRQAALASPGHFFMLGLPGAGLTLDPLLNRPISVLDVLPDDDGRPGSLVFLVKKVGRGTRLMSSVAAGATLRCTGPLGNTFPEPSPGERVVLVGGGVGIAPLHFCAARWAGRAALTVFYGGKRAADLPLLDRFGALEPGAVHVVTEDGSVGEEGLVTAPLGRYLADWPGERVYCCGPTPMMKAVCETAGDPARVWASLESRMACGIGICLGCALPVAAETAPTGPASPGPDVVMERVCKEGPVFRADRIVWEKLPA